MPVGQSGWTGRSGSVPPVVEQAVEPQLLTVEHDGRTIGALDWGGDGPSLGLLHPNGFCAGAFDPLAQTLRPEYPTLGIDLRGHGTSDAPTTYPECRFAAAGTDVTAMLACLGL